MSHVKTNKISPRKGTTTTIGDSGDSVTISSGTTITNAGTISTAGITGGTINNTTGTITGLQQQVSWQTGDIKTASFTASANEGYFLNTTSGQITVTLPASPTAGDVVAVKDYADTFDTNNLTINPNGNKIQGNTSNFVASDEGTAAILLYVDSTKGWLLVDQSKAADISEQQLFVTATGGTITTCGNFKIHTFTGPGTFCVSCAGNSVGSNKVDYLVVAGGGGSGKSENPAGAGGGGGYRTTFPSPGCNAGAFPITATAFPITVGGGGAAGCSPRCGVNGANSIFSTITSAGGGGGGGAPPGGGSSNGVAGGSGGGGAFLSSGGAGNTPPVSPPQGNTGGNGIPGAPPNAANFASGGGGGANAAGGNASSGVGGNGGAGATNSINGSSTAYAGGGGGGKRCAASGSAGSGGAGGGGDGSKASCTAGAAGTANTGGGAGGGGLFGAGSQGGSGVVVLRFPGPTSATVAPGTNTLSTCVGSCNEKVARFTVSGTLTIS